MAKIVSVRREENPVQHPQPPGSRNPKAPPLLSLLGVVLATALVLGALIIVAAAFRAAFS